MAVNIGDRLTTWFSKDIDGKSEIVKILPYTGIYPEWFNKVLVFKCPHLLCGKIEQAYLDKT